MHRQPPLPALCCTLALLGAPSCARPPEEAPLQSAAPACDFDGTDTARLPKAAWEPSSRLNGQREHERLRPGEAEPEAPRQVRIAIDATHHTSNQMSLYAQPGPDGLWRADIVESSGGGLARAPEETRRRERVFSASQSAEIDRLLADPCFQSEPTQITTGFNGVPGVPEYCSSMVVTEVVAVTAAGTRRSVQECGSWGVAGRLVRLLAPSR